MVHHVSHGQFGCREANLQRRCGVQCYFVYSCVLALARSVRAATAPEQARVLASTRTVGSQHIGSAYTAPTWRKSRRAGGAAIRANLLFQMVARGGIEPPTRGFSVTHRQMRIRSSKVSGKSGAVHSLTSLSVTSSGKYFTTAYRGDAAFVPRPFGLYPSCGPRRSSNCRSYSPSRCR